MRTYILALIFGFVLPSVLFSVFFYEKATDNGAIGNIGFSTTQTNASNSEIQIPVLDGDTVRILPLEEYLVGVVLKEMPVEFELEALKAQAVVARTYTLRADIKRVKHDQAAVCTDPGCCQGFCDVDSYLNSGGSEMNVERVKSAVAATEGVVVTYKGELIDATYFSCSGGMTEDAQAVWGADVPYLQATTSPGEENATHNTDTAEFTFSEFRSRLGLKSAATPPKIGGVVYTDGSGVDTMIIDGISFTGVALRHRLDLRSTMFSVVVTSDRVVVTTRGFGHRVGMSQYGAEAMALSGKNYVQILKHYYADVEITVLDD